MRYQIIASAAYACTLLTVIQAGATDRTPYFPPDQFANCVVALAHSKPNAPTLSRRLIEADALRKDATDGFMTYLHAQGVDSLPGLAQLAVSEREYNEVLAMHSTPLIDYGKYNWGRGFYHDDTLNRLGDLYRGLNSDRQTDLTTLAHPNEYLDQKFPPKSREAYLAFPEPQPKFLDMQITTQGLTDPLVKVLMTLPKNSLSHWDLVKLATDVYGGDVTTALGVIGMMFDLERVNVSHRDKRAILNTRMKPLFPKDQTDLVGYNYHFWLYMNAALQGNGWSANKISFIGETAQSDHGDRAADTLGISVGKAVRAGKDLNPTCPWSLKNEIEIPVAVTGGLLRTEHIPAQGPASDAGSAK